MVTRASIDPTNEVFDLALRLNGVTVFSYEAAVDRLDVAGSAFGRLPAGAHKGGWDALKASVAYADAAALDELRAAAAGEQHRRQMRILDPESAGGWRPALIASCWDADASRLVGVVTPIDRAMETSRDRQAAVRGPVLQYAVERGGFHAWYQPIITLETRRLAGFEALVRMPLTGGEVAAPGEFLPVAEELGLMSDIGAWMRTGAAERLAAWRAAALVGPEVFVNVNITPEELGQDGLVEEVAAVVRDYGLPPGALVLEVTETSVVTDVERASEVFKGLRTAGVGVALDDFGSGHSSLARLDAFALDVVKLDKAFINRLPERPTAQSIVRSVLNLASDLGFQVIAEGVENEDAADWLTEAGCAYGQGCLFSPPLAPHEVETYLGTLG